jgi:hypothetical protein
MPTISTTKSESVTATDLNLHAEEYTFAMVNELDFVRGRHVIKDFCRWNSFDDFEGERDGLFIGLSCAGRHARQVDIRLADFLAWSLHVGIAPSLRSLDQFAEQIHAFRALPRPRVKGVLLSNRAGDASGVVRSGVVLTLPIAPELYRQWLATLAKVDISRPAPSVDRYARYLFELWADPNPQ